MKKKLIALCVPGACAIIAIILAIYSALSGRRPDDRFDIGPRNLKSISDYVNPFHGTGGYPLSSGATYPGVSYPFGMIQLSPDTRYRSWLMNTLSSFNMANSGYYYGHDAILGFSHMRVSGGGIPSGGILRVIPSRIKSSHLKDYRNGASFKHENESAGIGAYTVKLDQTGVDVTLTAGEQSAIHRYKFYGQNPKLLFIDITSVNGSGNEIEDSGVEFDNEKGVFKGFLKVLDSFSRSYGGFNIYFSFRVNQMNNYNFLNHQGVLGKVKTFEEKAGLLVEIPESIQEAEIRFGFSFESIDKAFDNLQKIPGFDIQKKESENLWDLLLSRILVSSHDKEFLELFYSSLYHSLLMPNLVSINPVPIYTNFSLWDTFRTTHPLFNLAFKDYQELFINSLLSLTESGKSLPRWPYQTGETDIMIGSPSAIVIAEAAQTSLPDIGSDAFSTVLTSMLNDKELAICLDYGFCPGDKMAESVSKAVEYSWAFHSLKKWKSETWVQDLPVEGSMLWKAHWHPEEKKFLPKDSSGAWIEDHSHWLLSIFGGKHYTEGSRYHWLWGIPQRETVDELISMFGSEEIFISMLDDFMEKGAVNELGAIIPSRYYWHGNEHNLHAPFLFNFTSQPFLTQKWVAWILRHRYKNGPHGLDGNDDAGALGAWFVWTSLGLYPLAGSSMLTLTAPMIDSATITLSKGKTLRISVVRESENSEYIKSVHLDDDKICEPFVSYDKLHHSDELRFQLVTKPDRYSGFHCDNR